MVRLQCARQWLWSAILSLAGPRRRVLRVATCPFFARLEDGREHLLQLFVNLRICVAHHAQSLRCQPCAASCIALFIAIVCVAVDLDDQPRLMAVEIDDEPADRLLAPELVPAQLARPQAVP